MTERRSGQPAQARATLAQPRELVHRAFANPNSMVREDPTYWFDWVNDAVLLAEAERRMGNE